MSDLKLTKRQYKALLELVNLGNWMVNGIRSERVGLYDEVAQKVYAGAEAAGCGEFVDKEAGGSPPQLVWETDPESPLERYKEAYDEEVFWDELVSRLGERDFLREHSDAQLEKMTQEERFEARLRTCQPWDDEFCERGLDRVTLAQAKPEARA